MIKTLILIPYLDGGGTEYALLNMLNHYFNSDRSIKENINLTLFVIQKGGKLDSNFELIRSRNYHLTYLTSYSNIAKLTALIIRNKIGCKVLSKLIFRQSYDVGICFQESKWSSLIAYSDAFKKKITWFHSVINTNPGFRKIVNYKKSKKIYQSKINKFNKLVFVSLTAKEAFESIFNDYKKSTVVYNLLNVKELKAKSLCKSDNGFNSRGSYKILMVGNLLEVKNYFFALDVFQKLLELNLNFEVIILGDGILREKIHQEIILKRLKEKVILKGFVLNPFTYYREANLYLTTSLSEARPGACIDAVILEKPFLAPDIPAYKEVNELYCGGVIYSAGNLNSCVENFIKLYHLNEEEIKSKYFSRSPNWEEIGVEYLQLISGSF